MWFKRRKKTEQDHLLSESLRSLQTLLNESGRLEPSLDSRHTDESNMVSSDDTDTAGKPRPPRGGNESTPDEAPAQDVGNRWRDLSLNFDAEPVSPRPRRGGIQQGPETSGTAQDPVAQPETPNESSGDTSAKIDPVLEDTGPAGEDADVEEIVLEDKGPTDPDDEFEIEAIPLELPPLDTESAAPAQNEDDEPGIEYYDRVDSPTQEARDDVENADMLEIELPPVTEDEPAYRPVEPEAGDESAEDQLHLELESADDLMDDIPTLTDAVYIPGSIPVETGAAVLQVNEAEATAAQPGETEATAAQPGETEAAAAQPGETEATAAQPGETKAAAAQPVGTEAAALEPALAEIAAPETEASPYDEDIERCLENLRVRLLLMGLDALSAGQERELRDTLVDFLDEQGFSTGRDT